MGRKPREATERVLEMVEHGLIDKDTLIMACLKYMSEDDVRDMCHANEIELREEEDLDARGDDEDEGDEEVG